MSNAETSPGATPEMPPEWRAEFEAAAARPLALRMRYAFVRTYKPVLDDARFRCWDSLSDYRQASAAVKGNALVRTTRGYVVIKAGSDG